METRFLSIDIDFFYSDSYSDSFELFLYKLICGARRKNIPISSCMNHQQMLPLVSRSKSRTLVNIDAHSDLAKENTTNNLSCGTWVTYVPWRRTGTYIWYRNCYHKDTGDCDELFVNNDGSWRKSGWGKFKTEYWSETEISTRRLLTNTSEVCICSSPDFTEKDIYDSFTRIRKDLNLPYKKGRLNERFSKTCRPPYRTKDSDELTAHYHKVTYAY